MRITRRSTSRLIIASATGFWLAYFTPSSLFAAPDYGCADIRKAALKIRVHANNIANRITTRTPEGGAFKRVELNCESLTCALVPKSDFKQVYEPGHPDANTEGYVKYPVVDVGAEYAAVNTAATQLRILASKGVCGTKINSLDHASWIEYGRDTGLRSDIFNLSGDGRLVSWSRTDLEGQATNFNFNPDGSTPLITWNESPKPANKTIPASSQASYQASNQASGTSSSAATASSTTTAPATVPGIAPSPTPSVY